MTVLAQRKCRNRYAIAGKLLLVLVAAPTHAEDITKCLTGRAATEAGRYATGIEMTLACIKEGSLSRATLATSYVNLGIAYRRNQQVAKSIAILTEAIAMKSDDILDAYVNRGNAYDDAGRPDEAFADYNQALLLSPGDGDALYNRGILYEHRKNFGKAQSDFITAYNNGLRSDELHERLVTYHLIEPTRDNAKKPDK